MDATLLHETAQRLPNQGGILVDEVLEADQVFHTITETRQPERNQEAQQERDWITLSSPEEQQQNQVADIDAALARIEAGTYGKCFRCDREIEHERLRAVPTTELCGDCARQAEADAGTEPPASTPSTPVPSDDLPRSGRLPPDLDQLDNGEVAAQLLEMVKEDGQVDTEELQIHARISPTWREFRRWSIPWKCKGLPGSATTARKIRCHARHHPGPGALQRHRRRCADSGRRSELRAAHKPACAA